MGTTDWETLKRLFERAHELPAEERAAFLEEIGASDSEAQAELTSLLASAEEADPFFDSLAGAVLSLPPWTEDQTSTKTEPEPDPWIGKSVRQYRIERKLGAGGMGVVYRAHDGSLDRRVALKFLPPHLSTDEEATRRFLIEARAAAALDHPNVCAIYEIGRDEAGRMFIAMAHYEGETLTEKLERGPLPVEEACDYARQIAAGLAAAHAQGIAHRDIKPGNVIVTLEGVAKVLDFGLAKLTDVARTGTGVRLGTVAYMSPEQVRGQAVDHRTDLWSLGVVLHEMLTGHRPFRGDRSEVVIHAILHEEPEPPSAARSEVTPELDVVVGRLLAKDPEQRHASAEALAAGLSEAAARGGPKVRLRSWRALAPLAAIPVLAVGWWMFGAGQRASSGGADAEPVRPSIAVLPFVNIGGAEENQALTDGIHSDLITRIAGIGALKVISRTSVMEYRTTPKNVRTIGEELGVATVLEGEVQRLGDSLRINAQLIDATTDEHLWASSFDRRLTPGNIFAIQREITQEIVRALEATLSPSEQKKIETRPTESVEAYELYVRGLDHLSQRSPRLHQVPGGSPNILLAIEMLEQAVAADPSFALAHAHLSFAYGRAGRDKASGQAAETAVRLAPDLAEGHYALALVYQRVSIGGRGNASMEEVEHSIEEFEQAIRLNPNYAEALYHLGLIQTNVGRYEEGVASLERSFDLDPRRLFALANLGHLYTKLRRYEEAEATHQRVMRLNPERPTSYFWRVILYLAWGGDLARAGEVIREAEGRAELLKMMLGSWDFDDRMVMRIFPEAFDRDLDTLTLRDPRVDSVALYMARADRALGANDPAAARSLYQAALQILEARRSLRDHARFSARRSIALARLGREEEALATARRAVELSGVSVGQVTWGTLPTLAEVEVLVGEHEAAITHLEELLANPSYLSVPMLRVDPLWDPLRENPRFQALLEKYGS